MELTSGPGETEALAAALAPGLPHGAVICLEGPLGAGKTTFVRGLVAGCGGDPAEVASPTYLGCLPYETPEGTVLHLDLYRGSDPAVLAARLEEAAQEEPRLVAVEWAGAAVPGAWSVTLSDGREEDEREIEVEGP